MSKEAASPTCKQHNQRILLFVVFVFFQTAALAQSDTLIVRGKVENLSLALYRQAPHISVTRVNILQPNREIVRFVQLQPDGSFELKMPLIYPREECHLNYANLSVPFLGEKGVVELKVYGDSLGKSDTPLLFGGKNAATNNGHISFDAAFNKWLKANPEQVTKRTTAFQFWENAMAEQNRRIDFYRTNFSSKDTLLTSWIAASLREATKARFFAFLTQQKQTMPIGLILPMDLDTTHFLTFSKADCYQQFTDYALATTPNLAEGALAVNKLAHLILKYVPNLSDKDSLKFARFVQGQSAQMSDLKWLSALFNQKENTLRHIVAYELYLKKYAAVYPEKELNYLSGAFYIQNLYNFTTQQMRTWYTYIRPTLQNAYYARSLDEVHYIESQDTTEIEQAIEKIYTLNLERTADKYFTQLSPDVEVYRDTRKDGNELWGEIKQKTKDKIVFVIFWANDEFGRRTLAESRELRAKFPEDKVAFVYLCEHNTQEEVWVENVVKSKTRGLHVLLEEDQNDFFVNEWRINRVPYCVLVDANGKYIDRDAPLPADHERWNKILNKTSR